MPVNYLTNGVAGTIWDGIYLGAGEIANATGIGAAAGSVSTADADLSGNGVLTISSLQTDWENTADDGVFLFKVITGDFDMSVHVVGPTDTGAYNLPGLMVRAFGAHGAPSPGGAENSFLWARFDWLNYVNLLKNNVNGAKTDTTPGAAAPNTNYWLRITRTGDVFTLYEKSTQAGVWNSVGTVTRADFSGQFLQVGIEHSDYGGGATRTAQYDHFSLTVSNLGPFATPPLAATNLTMATNGDGTLTLSWAPGSGSNGSLVAMWTGNPTVKEAPADGFTYNGNAAYGFGDTLPTLSYYVVYSGSGTNVTVSNLTAGTAYSVAVFAYSGSSNSTVYTHTPATGSFVATGQSQPQVPITVWAAVRGTNVLLTNNAILGKWYWAQYTDSLNPANWQPVGPFALPATSGSLFSVHTNGALLPQRFYRVRQFDVPPEGVNLAPNALPTTSYVSPWENLYAINDGHVPANSADHSNGAYGNWPTTGTNWVEYDWSAPVNVNMVDVYWWQDNAGVYAPASCSLQYWDGSSFVPVNNPMGLGIALNQFNTTTFATVTTTRLRLLFASDASGHSTGILEWRVYDAGGSPTNWPGAPTNSLFTVRTIGGAITSLKRAQDSFPTEYLAGRLGDVTLKYLSGGDSWVAAQTATLADTGAGTFGWSSNGTEYMANYQITNGASAALALESNMDFSDTNAIVWTLNITNLTEQPLVIGDLAVPLQMNTVFSGVTSSVLKHSFISGYGSYVFWMRPNSVGPYLLMTPLDNTKLEYWDTLGPGSETFFGETLGGYEAYIHSYVASTNAAAQYPSVTTQGDRWRQPNTSLTLAPGASQTYGFKFQWANGYDDIRQKLVDEGKVDVHIVPGMTVPTNLFVQIALNCTQTVSSVAAEFPSQTQIQLLGTTNVSSDSYQIYQVQFSRLGENELTVTYGNSRTMYLEFFATEPVETLIKKRAAFIAGHQVLDTNKWYDGLFCEWNMNDQVMLTPDNYDTISGFYVYEVASDDPGEARPAYLATKEAVFPVQNEVSALDYYIQHFVWGGLQRTTNETYSYGIYGIPDWHTLRTNNNLSLGRGYDYPHIVVMYYGMYQVAKYHPEITTSLSAQEYLERAWGTAVALYTVAGGAQAQQIGLMNEMITPEVIDALQTEGLTNEAATLREYWEQKANYFVTGNPNLFGSEFSFDSTGFETQEALAHYAVDHAGADPLMGSANPAAFLQQAQQFMSNEITANVFDRGWLEPAYYDYGSDYRALQGDSWVLSYMAQMGGWGILDYALNFATNYTDYLRLGYASILSGWATMNSGPPPDYGFWYPGAANDGGAGGGFEPSPYNPTWLSGQPMHRGAWYYCAEGNLGFCAAVRAAATILADDPIFDRFCYGGDWQETTNLIQITPKDGVRQRFHALLGTGQLHLQLVNDQFNSSNGLALQEDLSQVSFAVETSNPAAHNAILRFSTSTAGTWTVSDASGTVTNLNLQAGEEAEAALPMSAGGGTKLFSISR